MEDLFQLHAIGANVLHRGGADAPRDQREVFHPGYIPIQAVLDEPVPRLSRPGLHIYMTVILPQGQDAF